MHHDIEVTFYDDRAGNEITSIPVDSMYDALDEASNAAAWQITGFVHIWQDGFVEYTFYSHDEALRTYESAIGR
jgi:hypothetical protein